MNQKSHLGFSPKMNVLIGENAIKKAIKEKNKSSNLVSKLETWVRKNKSSLTRGDSVGCWSSLRSDKVEVGSFD